MRRSRIAVVVVVIALAAWWWLARSPSPGGAPAAETARPAATRAGHDRDAPARAPGARLALGAAHTGEVTITGRVIDIRQQQPVGNVEIVFRSPSDERTTITRRDGTYSIAVGPGIYRAFVRDDTVLSVGGAERTRLPGPPAAETAGIPDEALMSIVLATSDTDGVDFSVVRGGVVAGRVVDRSGRPIAGAVVRARGGNLRPTLATDIAETDGRGTFELRIPAGAFDLDASHPRFAGVASAAEARVAVEPGQRVQATVTLTAGCVITGRVIARDGSPASDGAIEKQWGDGDLQYAPAGRIEPDGRFRWATTDETEVTLRAWPWKSPPSPGRRFGCRDGARFDDVVFQLPDRRPDLEGVLVDAGGEPVGFTFIDLAPLDPGGVGQQERTDANGRWEVYHMPPGRYRVTAHAEGRGITTATIVSPRDGVRLALGGTGRLEGTTTRLPRGSFELVLGTCIDPAGMISLPQSRRLVTVTGGRFTVDDLPACELSFAVLWHGRAQAQRVAIPAGGAGFVELDLGEPRAKTVRGVVRDTAGKPLAGAVVTATYQTTNPTTVRTDGDGAYTIKTFSSASLRATAPGLVGFGQVGGANVDTEQVDLVVEDASDADD